MAQQEYVFLKLGDIKGKATTDAFKDQIVLQNMSYGISQGGQWEEQDKLSGRITNFSDLSCVKLMDVSSPALATACALKTQYKRRGYFRHVRDQRRLLQALIGKGDHHQYLHLHLSRGIRTGGILYHQLPQRHVGIRHRQGRLRPRQERQGVGRGVGASR